MKWWITLLTKHELFKVLGKVTVLHALILLAWFLPLRTRLLISFILPLLLFVVAFWIYHKILLSVKRLGKMPNYGTLGYWFISLNGAIIALLIVVPTILGLTKSNDENPITIFSYIFLYAWSYMFWTLFLIAYHAYEKLTGKTKKD